MKGIITREDLEYTKYLIGVGYEYDNLYWKTEKFHDNVMVTRLWSTEVYEDLATIYYAVGENEDVVILSTQIWDR